MKQKKKLPETPTGPVVPFSYAEPFCPEPTYFFEVGEQVEYGAFDESYVTAIREGGKILELRAIVHAKKTEHKTYEYEEKFRCVEWYQVRRLCSNREVIVKPDDTRLDYSQRSMMDIIYKVFSFGCDMNPEYQRELVWELSDKVALIDSIFNHVDIGKFVFVKLPFVSGGPSYEILDGKQRVNALVDFYLDKFTYQGLTYSQMSPRDQTHFENVCVSVAELNKPADVKLLYKYFVKLNTAGKPMPVEQIEKVKKMIQA